MALPERVKRPACLLLGHWPITMLTDVRLRSVSIPGGVAVEARAFEVRCRRCRARLPDAARGHRRWRSL